MTRLDRLNISQNILANIRFVTNFPDSFYILIFTYQIETSNFKWEWLLLQRHYEILVTQCMVMFP